MTPPYFKLATFNAALACWKDGRRAYPTYTAARAAATAPGVYRISTVTEEGREDGQPFVIEGARPASAPRPPPRGGPRRRPGPWNMWGR